MKDQISSYELACMVKELQVLKDARMDKIYQKDKEFLFQIHVTSKGKHMLRVVIPNYLYLTDYKGDFPTTPPGLCVFLRKKLKNARLREIEQLDFERILRLKFSTKDAIFYLFLEFIPPGNLVVCDENLKILSAKENKRWKDRTIRGGVEYTYPKQKYNFFKLTKSELKEALENTKSTSIVKALAVELSLGGIYAEEVCALAKINKDKSLVDKDVDENTIDRLFKAIKELQKLPLCSNKIGKEMFPISLKTRDGGEESKTFNELFNNAFTKKAIAKQKDVAQGKYETDLKKIDNMVKAQEATLVKMGKQSSDSQAVGEKIYENYQFLKEFLDEFNSIRKKHTWDDIKKKLKGHKLVKEINEKKKEIIIEI